MVMAMNLRRGCGSCEREAQCMSLNDHKIRELKGRSVVLVTHKIETYLNPRIRKDVYANIRRNDPIPSVRLSVPAVVVVDVWTSRNSLLARFVQSAFSTTTAFFLRRDNARLSVTVVHVLSVWQKLWQKSPCSFRAKT
jgi:hypothetical protein